MQAFLLHDLVSLGGEKAPDGIALTHGEQHYSYLDLASGCVAFSNGLLGAGVKRGDRVAIYLEKRIEGVIACFGTSQAGGVMVPLNPLLKPAQVAHILRDCSVSILVTSPERLALLEDVLTTCPDLLHIVLTGNFQANTGQKISHSFTWTDFLASEARQGHRILDSDMAAILYTSGSTGLPKGVVVSHRNLVVGASSVANYLGNHAGDTLLAALPVSFDAGFSQLTTAFFSGARVVLLNYLFARDVLQSIEKERVTGLTAVPPLYMQLCRSSWPDGLDEHLRYFANTGGRLPVDVLRQLQRRLPRSKPFLMYGLTEAFRSTYLSPEEVEKRPDSIGKAIPNAEIFVLRRDGTLCSDDEEGELVHRGPLVSMGYWGDVKKTEERFRSLPPALRSGGEGLMIDEVAVFSGDTVRRDVEGFLYFVGRNDEMIKTSGYRISPTEIEEVLYASGLVGECVVFGVDDIQVGQRIQVVATPVLMQEELDVPGIASYCKLHLPVYMQPASIEKHEGGLPRNPNGKIDRSQLRANWLIAHSRAN